MQPHDADQPTDGRPANDPGDPIGGRPLTGNKVPTILNSGPTPANLFRCLQRRLVLGVGAGLLLATIAATATWLFAPQPKHTIRTLISVPPERSAFIAMREVVPDPGSHQRNQMASAKSQLVLSQALKDPKVANLRILQDINPTEGAEWLEKEVQVDFTVAPEIMKISMRGMETDDLKVLVTAVREAYVREILDRRTVQRRSRLTVLEELVRKYETQLNQLRQAQKDDQDGGGANKNADVRGRTIFWFNQQLATYEKELLATESQLRQAKIKLAELQVREKNFAAEKIPDIDVTKALHQHKAVKAFKDEIMILETKIADTIERSARGDKDPAVKALRDKAKLLQGQIDKVGTDKSADIRKELKEARRQELQRDIFSEESRIQTLTVSAKVLTEDRDRVKGSLEQIGRHGAKLDTVQHEITHLEGTLKTLKHEQEAIKIQLEVPSSVQVIEDATASRADPLLRRIMMTAGAALAGMVFALFGIAWMEYRTRRVDSVDEVVIGLGMRLVGTVPAAKHKGRKTGAKSVDPAQQVLTESVDAARTMLLHLARTHSLRTVMVTSAVAGEGKTSLSCHLAASLARAGLRMLLIDGDMRNPTAHRLFGIPCDAGFCEVLTDKVEVEKAIKQTALRGLYLMPAGNWTDQTALAVSQGKPAALFDQLRQQFDLIIIDSSPILPVADGLMIGQQVDGVLLSVLCQVSRLTNLYAAWQRIEQLGVRPLGVVINGVSANLYGSTYSYPYPRRRRAAPKPAEKGSR
jgi:capsular exopolysaccharide synthesis family protein